jgi:hypothetical protein
MVEGEQGSGGITAATTESGSDWNTLVEGDVYPFMDMKCLLQELGGSDDEVAVIRWKPRWDAGQPNSIHLLRAKGEPITEVEHLQDGLESMIAIGPLAQNTQAKIDFGWRGEPAANSLHGG